MLTCANGKVSQFQAFGHKNVPSRWRGLGCCLGLERRRYLWITSDPDRLMIARAVRYPWGRWPRGRAPICNRKWFSVPQNGCKNVPLKAANRQRASHSAAPNSLDTMFDAEPKFTSARDICGPHLRSELLAPWKQAGGKQGYHSKSQAAFNPCCPSAGPPAWLGTPSIGASFRAVRSQTEQAVGCRGRSAISIRPRQSRQARAAAIECQPPYSRLRWAQSAANAHQPCWDRGGLWRETDLHGTVRQPATPGPHSI